MSCFLSAATPSRFSACTGVYLLFLGSGMRICCAPACIATDNTDNTNKVSNGERIGLKGPRLGARGSTRVCVKRTAVGTQNRKAVALPVFLDGETRPQVGLPDSCPALPSELLLPASNLCWKQVSLKLCIVPHLHRSPFCCCPPRWAWPRPIRPRPIQSKAPDCRKRRLQVRRPAVPAPRRPPLTPSLALP